MSENDITKEMLMEKLFEEMAYPRKSVSSELVDYRRDAFDHIYKAMEAVDVPGDLLRNAHRRDDAMNQIYLFWVEKASEGDSVVDKPDLAVECVKKWLLDVRSEYRHDLLYNRFAEEREAFLAAERLKTPDEIIEDAWKITCYNDLVMLMESVEFEQHEVDALLTLENPLSSIYDEVLSEDDNSIMDSLRETAERVALERVEEMDNPFFAAEPSVQKYVDEFIECHCEPMEDEQEPDDGFEPEE